MIAADCRAPGCGWRTAAALNTVDGLSRIVAAIVGHCRNAHGDDCREISVVVHVQGPGCDHAHPAA